MKYQFDIAVVVYRVGVDEHLLSSYTREVVSVVSWLQAHLPHLTPTFSVSLSDKQPSLRQIDAASGTWLDPMDVDWSDAPPGEITVLLWQCPPDRIPSGAGLTWPVQSWGGQRRSVITIPYLFSQGFWTLGGNLAEESGTGFASQFETTLAHELKTALLEWARAVGVRLLNTYGPDAGNDWAREEHIDCALYPDRRACYEAVLAQFNEEVCYDITGGKLPKPEDYTYADEWDVDGHVLHYHVTHVWNGQTWERAKTLVRDAV